jgi:HTH-type transcriptional regulator/antitoxin HigA
MSIKPIKTDQDYDEAIVLLNQLIDMDPDPDTAEGDQLSVLSTLIEDYETRKYPQTLPSPIEAIKFRMEQANLKPSDLIPYIGSRSRVSEILAGKRPLTLDMIRALDEGLGIPAKVLIQKPNVSSGQFQSWSEPLVKEMGQRGYFGADPFNGANKESLLSAFFNGRLPTQQLAWRKTRISVRTDEYALLAWAEYIQKKADAIHVPVKYKRGLVDLAFMQRVAKLSAQDSGPQLAIQFLLDHGIVVVIAKHLPKTRVDGAVILKDKDKPVIGLSLRFDRLDNFWFTLLHELAHISLHLEKAESTIYFDELEEGIGVAVSEDEAEADALAQESIVPRSKWEISPAKITPSPMAAQSLANELGVHVAVIAGIIRHKHQNYFYLKKIVNDESSRVRHFFADSWS